MLAPRATRLPAPSPCALWPAACAGLLPSKGTRFLLCFAAFFMVRRRCFRCHCHRRHPPRLCAYVHAGVAGRGAEGPLRAAQILGPGMGYAFVGAFTEQIKERYSVTDSDVRLCSAAPRHALAVLT